MGVTGCSRPPLRQPPLPLPRKPVLWGIATDSKLCGSRLVVKSQCQYSHPAGGVPTATTTTYSGGQVAAASEQAPLPAFTTAADVIVDDVESLGEEESGDTTPPAPVSPDERRLSAPPSSSSSIESQDFDMLVLPEALQQRSSLTPEEFRKKLQQFKYLLLHCQAGTARTMLLTWAIIVVSSFMTAYMVPGFWSSTIFSKPWFLLGFGTTQVVLMTMLLCWQRRDVERLKRDTRELFRPWRRQFNVEVSFYQTTHIVVVEDASSSFRENHNNVTAAITHPTTRRHRRFQTFQGSFNFVLVFGVVRSEDVEALELASLDGTVKMSADDSSSRNY